MRTVPFKAVVHRCLGLRPMIAQMPTLPTLPRCVAAPGPGSTPPARLLLCLACSFPIPAPGRGRARSPPKGARVSGIPHSHATALGWRAVAGRATATDEVTRNAVAFNSSASPLEPPAGPRAAAPGCLPAGLDGRAEVRPCGHAVFMCCHVGQGSVQLLSGREVMTRRGTRWNDGARVGFPRRSRRQGLVPDTGINCPIRSSLKQYGY